MKFFDCRRFAGILLLFVLTCGGCTGSSEKKQKQPITSIQQLNDPAYTIAVAESGAYLDAVKRDIPKAKRIYLSGQPAYDSVRMSKADAYAFDRRQMEIAIAEGLKGVRILPDSIGERNKIAVGLSRASKFPDLKSKINTFIAEMKADGTLQDMYRRWAVDRNYTMPDIPVPEKADTKIVVGTTGLIMPFSYYEGNILTGFDVELSRRLAKWLGAALEFKVYDFDGIIAAANSGAVDCVMSDLNITPERAEKIDFSDVLYTEEVALMVKDDAAVSESEASAKKGYYSVAELDGKRIGVFTGAIHDQMVKKVLPKAECVYFDAMANALSALTSGKIDALACDEQIVKAVEQENSSVRHIDEYLDAFDNAFIAAKTPEGDKIRTQLNEFIRSIKADGTLAQILDIWEGTDESKKTLPDYKNYPGTNGTIRIAAESETVPFTYIKDGRLVGYEIDIIARFCKAYGYRPDIDAISFPAIIPAVMSGKYVLGAASFTITEERKETVNFSEPVYTGGAMLLVKKTPEDLKADTSSGGFTKISDLNGKRIGVLTGSIGGEILKGTLPAAKVSYLDNYADMSNSLSAGKIDAILEDDFVVFGLEHDNPNFKHIDGYLRTFDKAFIFTKSPEGDKIRTQFNEFIRTLKADSTLKKISDVWLGFDENAKILPDYENYPDTNGTIKFAVDNTTPTFSYVKDGRIVGYDVDILARFCKAYGYRPEPSAMNFSGELPAVNSGRCLVGISAIAITPERAETVNFSEPVYTGGAMLLVKKTPEELRASESKTPSAPAKYTKLADLRGKRIGIQTGVDSWARLAKELIPDAEVLFFNDITSLALALENGKIDAFLENNVAMAMLTAVKKNITVLDENIPGGYSCAVAFRRDEKGQKLKAQWDEYIAALKKDGKINAIMNKWTGADESAKTVPDYESFPAPNGVLVMPTDGVYPPLSYYSGNTLKGFEIDLAARFCETYGYGLKIKLMSFPGLLPSIATGKCDFSVAAASVTEEHKETVMLSEPLYTYTTKIAVLADESESAAATVNTAQEKYTSLAYLNGKKIGVPTGVDEWTVILSKILPDAEPVYYNTTADLIAALESGKIEAFPCDAPVLDLIMSQNKNIAALDATFPEAYEAGVAFPKTEKGRKLKAQWDEYITSLKTTGKLEGLVRKWTGADEAAKTIPDYESFPAPNGVLFTATNGDYPPFNYYSNNKLKGLEIDLAAGFCQAYGYGLKYRVMTYDGILPSVKSGKSDFVLAALSLTEEHAENLLFSIPYHTFTTKIAVLAPKKETPAPAQNIPDEKYTRLAPLNGKKIGVITGVDIWAEIVHKVLPDAEVAYYNGFADMSIALLGGKIAAFVCDVPVLDMLMKENKNIASMGIFLHDSMDIAVGFPTLEKSLKLKSQWDEFLTALKNNGELDSIMHRWTSSENPDKDMPDYKSLPSPNGELVMATDGENPPFSYYIGTKLAGFEVELAARFCAAYGYGLKFKVMAYDAVIAALQSEKCDFALADIPPSDEHAENLLFSIPYYACSTTFAVPANSPLAAKAHDTKPAAPAPKAPAAAESPRTQFGGFNDFAGKKIGAVVGTTGAETAAKTFPNAEIAYFDSRADVLTALKQGKIDAVCTGYNSERFFTLENEDFAILGGPLTRIDSAPVFAKTKEGRKLCEQFTEFLTAQRNNGFLNELDSIWFGSDNSRKTAKDFSSLPAVNGTLKMAVDTATSPFVYVKDNKILGYDVDCAVKFCEEYGYGLKIVPMNFGAIIPAVLSGKCDFALCNISITEERKESVLFSVPNLTDGDAVLVRKADLKPAVQAVSSPAPSSGARFSSIADLAGKKIAVVTGTTHPQIAAKHVPTAELMYFNNAADAMSALKAKKVDAVCTGTIFLRYMMAEDDSVAPLGEQLTFTEGAPMFPKTEKGRKLCEQFSEFAKACWDNGTIAHLESMWFDGEESKRVMKDYSDLPSPNGVLKMAVNEIIPPCVYTKNNRIVGYDVDFAVRFCEAYGYGLKVIPMSFAGIIPALSTGRCDFGIGAITITDERKESVLFSYPNLKAGNVFAVRKSDIQHKTPAASAPSPRAKFSSIANLAGKRIAVTTGMTHGNIAMQYVPDAKLLYFDTVPDTFTALKTMKADAVCTAVEIAKIAMAQDDSFALLGEQLTHIETAPIFPKTGAGRKLCAQFSEFIKPLWDDGTVQKVHDTWFGSDESSKTIKDYTKFPAPNGILRAAVDAALAPYIYVKGNKIVGYDIDLAVRFCEAYGYGLEIVPMNFAGIIPAVQSGRCDFGIGAITITDERKENVLFSEPFMKSGNVFVVRKEDIHSPEPNSGITNINELNGKRIGVQTGTTHPQIASHYVPAGKLVYFDTTADVFTALKAGKIDAVCTNTPIARFIMIDDDSITMLGDEVVAMDCSPIFPKTQAGEKLREQFSEFIRSARKNGTLQEIDSIWFGKDDSKRTVKDYFKLPAPNGKLKMLTDPTLVPFAYVKNNRIVGYEVDCAVRFCEAYGYGLEVVPMNFGAIIPALVSGKYDFAACSIAYTPERAENVLYAESNLKSGYAFFVKTQKQLPKSQHLTLRQPAGVSGMRLDDLNGKKVGIILGANHDTFVAKKIPDAKIEYFSDLSTITLALRNRKISAFANTLPTAIYMTNAQKDLAYISEPVESTYTYSGFTNSERGRKLCEEYAEFLRTLWEDGTIDRLADKWVYSENESARTVEDYSKLPAVNGVLKMAIDTGRMPFAYVKDNRIIGYDIELAVMFCKAKGYGLEVYSMDFAGILGSIKTGKCDLTGSITWTEERAETMLYSSVPNAQTDIVLLVMKTQDTATESASGLYKNIQDLAGKKVAVQTGTVTDQITVRFVPEAKCVYFDTQADLVTALKTNKADAVCTDIPIGKYMMSEYDNMTMLGDPLTEDYLAPIFPKTEAGRKLCEKFSEFTKAAWKNGTIQELESIWFGQDDKKRAVKDYSKLPAPNGILKMAADPLILPFTYMKNNRIIGYDVDFAVRFCEAYGYGLEIVPMNFAGIIPAVMTGKCDFALSSITVTEERAESVLFAEPNAKSGVGFFVRKSDTQPQAVRTSGQYTTLEDVAAKRIGVQTGTVSALLVEEKLPNAKIQYFDALSDTLIALKAGKIDALAATIFSASHMVNTNDDVTILNQWLRTTDISPIFTKSDRGRKLCEEYSEFLKGLWEDGTIDRLNEIWLGPDESRKIIKDYSKLPAHNGTIRLAVDTSMPPLAYVRDNRVVGYDIDLAVRFCEAKGYGLQITQGNVSAVLAEVMSGKSDLTMSLMYTEERAENALFPSTPSGHSGNVVVVLKAKPVQTSGRYNSIQELSGKKIGVQTGTTNERLVAENIPTATRVYFNTLPDALLALKTGKIDAICCSVYAARYMAIENDDITYLENMLAELDLMPIFSPTDKGKKLRDEYSKFLKGLWEDGTINEIDSVWLGKDDSKRVIKDYSKLPAPNGVLKMAAEPTDIPFVYMKDNQFVGYDVDIAVRFCESHGYGLEVVPMSFSAVISSINSGKTDFSASMHWNPERAKSALFASVPTAHSGNVLVVMKAQDAPAEETHSTEGEYSTFEELAGKTVGVQTGTLNDQFTLKVIPTARVEYFDSIADIVTALKMRKIDAGSIALNVARFLMLDNEDLALMGQSSPEMDAAPIFAKTDKGRKLCEKFNEFIKAQQENGSLQELQSIWFGRDDSKRKPTDYASLPATNGKLRMAVDISLYAPFAYVKDNKIVGYEIDFAAKFCKEYGYGLEVVPMNYFAIIEAVQSGKCDFASCSIAITPERAEQVLFASPNAKTGCALVVRKADLQSRLSMSSELHSKLQELAGKRIGVQPGTRSPEVVKQLIPEAERVYQDTPADSLIALRTRKIDAVALADQTARMMMAENKDIAFFCDRLTNVEMKSIFPNTEKGRMLCEEYSKFVRGLWDDGSIKKIDSVWIGNDESKKTVRDYTKFPVITPKGTLRMAVDNSMMPFVYVKDNKITGYDIDIAVRFCAAKGYGLEIVPMVFSGIIPAVNTGKCDFSCGLTYTPERAENVLFASTPNATSGMYIVVMKDSLQASAPAVIRAPSAAPSKPAEAPAKSQFSAFMEDAREFFEELKASFNRTFLREERWRLFVEGIINTMIITVLSILCGTILGFVVYLLCRGGNIFANLITRFFIWLIEGTPMVVLLMILYYIIFGKVDIPGIWVAVIAFTMTFGAGFFGMLKSGTGALDRGQTEAAYALGFSDTQTFFTVILPQAALHFMPAYKSSVVALIKSTAIVGYIAVQDLTKMGDIVRSRTYEAFFPLIAVAVIYFVLAGLLNIIVGIIHNRIRPEKRTKDDILKGVETHD